MSGPTAPGRLGVAASPAELLAFLEAMGSWLGASRAELDRLDAAARATPRPEDHMNDVVLAFSLWQAIRTRTDELLVVWDSGRAGVVERERMSGLIWGRLDDHAGAATLSMVEATALLDAIAGQLRSQLGLDGQAADFRSRIAALRAAIVRCEDLAEPPAPAVAAARRRLDGLSSQAERGGDITGPLRELEAEAARMERDLIVAATRRREARRAARQAEQTIAALGAREPTLRALAARCRAEIAHPPRLAIPRVAALEPVPTDHEALAAFAGRLGAVAHAMDTVEAAYAQPLRERAQLRYRLGRARASAQANGRMASPTVAAGCAEACEAVEATPCDVPVARFAVEQFEYLARDLPDWARRATP